jgi:hypothetical protein
MYFSVKAFQGTTRRFENLDNTQELNEFVADRIELGFTKFIVKSYDENGHRKTRFMTTEGCDWVRFVN